jgi:uncharacterized protein
MNLLHSYSVMKLLLSFLVLFSPVCAVAQDPRDTAIQNTMLWKITGNNLANPSYLYGTFHVYCQNNIVIPAILREKLVGSKTFFLETIYTQEIIDSIKSRHKKKKGLKKQLGYYCYKQAKEILTGYFGTINDDSLNALTPAEASYRIMEATIKCRLYSYDETLFAIANENKLHLRQLESLQQRKDILYDLTPAQRAADLCNFITRRGIIMENIRKNAGLYQNRDINALYRRSAYLPNGLKNPSKDQILDKRNKLWIPVIEAAIQQESCFFAFGCAHLAGWNGIISLLRQRGYTVTPVKM